MKYHGGYRNGNYHASIHAIILQKRNMHEIYMSLEYSYLSTYIYFLSSFIFDPRDKENGITTRKFLSFCYCFLKLSILILIQVATQNFIIQIPKHIIWGITKKKTSIEHWCMAWYCVNYRVFRLKYWSNIFV